MLLYAASLLPGASAADLPNLPTVHPFAWVRPGFTWIADDPANPTAQDGFTAEARIGVEASVPDVPIAAKIELALLPEPQLTDAHVIVTPVSLLDVRLGQMKVPFSLHRLASDTRRQLPQGVGFLSEAGIGREIGADVSLRVPIAGQTRATITSGAYNGEGANRIQNVNQRFLYAQRVLVTPLGARKGTFEGTHRKPYVGIGGGWLYDYEGDGLTAAESNTFGAEIQLSWELVSFQAEAVDQEIVHANVAVADYHVQGAYGQLGSFVPAPWARDHVEVVGRWEVSEPNTTFGAAAGEAQPDLQATETIVGGVNYYVRGAPERFHDLKVQVAYAHVNALEGEDANDDSFTVSATARF
ncbi:MAG: porin [Pseudomonadota bacterium]|nr:porin [Pseudomonadota bacterium]